MAVCIHEDIAQNRGLYSYYAPWLDSMMNKFGFTECMKEEYTLVITDCNGKHIGCSGAVTNTLIYYNPNTELNKRE